MSDTMITLGPYTAESSYLSLRHTLQDIIGDVTREAGLDAGSDRLDRIELCLAEVMNNIVEHAYGEVPDHRFMVEGTIDRSTLLIRITDTGAENPVLSSRADAARPVARNPVDLPPRNDPYALKEGGYGLSLAREIADSLTCTREGDTNVTELSLKL